MSSARLPWRHALLAVAVVAVWGTNFPIMKVAMAQIPPFTLATLRFLFALFPAVFFLKRPNVPWSNLAAYGLFIGVGQFGVIYFAVNGFISPGLASLLVQTHVFFTILLAIAISGERVAGHQWVGLGLAIAGVMLVGVNTGGDVTAIGIALVLAGGFNWGVGNIVSRAAGPVNMLAYVVWSSMFCVVPLALLALSFEGAATIRDAVAGAGAMAGLAVLWQAVGNTLFGFAIWAWLLARHPAALITPMALLVPVFGMASSALWLGEPLQPWKIAAALLVISGLAVNMLWRRRPEPLRAPAE